MVYVGNEMKFSTKRRIFGWHKKKFFLSNLNDFIIIMVLLQIGISLVKIIDCYKKSLKKIAGIDFGTIS